MSNPAQTISTCKSSEPKVSVIIPIYNVEKYLKKCLDSVLNQTHKNLEIILVDDGSTDNSGNLAKDYASRDSRVTIVRQENQGQSAARNTGLSLATGDFISFVDSDDEVKPTFIEELLTPYIADKNTILSVCGIHYTRLQARTAEDVYISPLRARHTHESLKAYHLYLLARDGRMYSSVNKLYLAKFAKKCHFDPHLNFAEDTKFVLDYISRAAKPTQNPTYSFVLNPLYIYNSGTVGSTMRSVATKWPNWQRSYRDLKAWLGPHPSTRERFFLHLVHLRWRISHLKQLLRAR